MDGAWQNVLDCIDRFVAVFNLGGQSASLLESAANEVLSIVITFISFFQHHLQNMWIYLKFIFLTTSIWLLLSKSL